MTGTIPLNAPIPDYDQKYLIVYVAKNSLETQTQTEYFFVRQEGDPITLESASLVLPGGNLTDTLATDGPISQCHIRLIDEYDNQFLYDVVNTSSPRIVNNTFYYDYVSPMPIQMMVQSPSVAPFFAEWTFIGTNNLPQIEVHPIYVTSSKMFMFIDGVRRMIDKIRNLDINPNLQYTNVDLAHYVLDGMQMVNATKPTLTSYNPSNVPPVMYIWVKKAAALFALRAQYLAEGCAAFDFQGATVQLNVDRTQYIDTMIGQLQQDIDQNLPLTKKLAVRMSGAGILGISVSPSLNFQSWAGARTAWSLLRNTYMAR